MIQMDTGGIAIIGGVPGVGKTTVINKALEIAQENSVEIANFVFGSVMMEIAEKEYNVQDRDALRKLPTDTQKQIQRYAAIKIADRARGKITIVDTHYMIKTGVGHFLPGIPSWVSDALKPKLLVLIEADPKAITSRRSEDDSRLRDADTLELLKDHQAINKAIAVSISQQTGALISIIENKQGEIDRSGRELFEQLVSIKE